MEFKRNNKKQIFNGEQPRHPDPELPKNSWFDEEEEWGDLKERVKRQAAEDVARNRYHPTPKPESSHIEPDKVEYNIRLQLPKISTQKIKMVLNPVFFAGKVIKDAPGAIIRSSGKQKAAVACAVILAAGGIFAYKHFNKKEIVAVQGTSVATTDENPVSHDPGFDIVLPEGREIPKESIAYNSAKHFAKYDDDINTIKVTVSQQPLPESFKEDTSARIQKMAEEFGAREKLTLDDQDMYYGKQEKGIETMILAKKDTMIFILTSNLVGKESLKAYAYNLN